jgi:hypothetical protein
MDSEEKIFMKESEIENFFLKHTAMMTPKEKDLSEIAKVAKEKENPFYKWVQAGNAHPFTYDHMAAIAGRKKNGNAVFDCDTITDCWYRWFFTIPGSMSPGEHPGMLYGDTNRYDAFLFSSKKVCVYFAAVTPFQKPDIRTITLTKNAPLLVPVYNVSASRESYPSLKKDDTKLLELVMKDLSGVKADSVQASFDGDKFYGCCVIRRKPIEISIPNVHDNIFGIPEDRLQESDGTVHTCHGGFWLLIKERFLTVGEHLLEFAAASKNYEIQSKILIRVLK